MAQSGEEYLAVLKASYDYEPQSEDEIAIKENQIVFLLEKTDDELSPVLRAFLTLTKYASISWWKVKIKGDSQDADSPAGLIPAAYVEQVRLPLCLSQHSSYTDWFCRRNILLSRRYYTTMMRRHLESSLSGRMKSSWSLIVKKSGS